MPQMKKCTAVLHVEAVEPCLAFWTERLGFAITAQVPHEDKVGFAILVKDGVELMYQSTASIEADTNVLVPLRGTMLFIEVDDVEACERAMQGAEIVVPRRKTFYGSDEIFVREPGGHIVGFAQMGA